MMVRKLFSNYTYGIYAEWLVIIYLVFKFYRILKVRYKNKAGEIDIIAKKKNRIIFIEVKARKNHLYLAETISNYQLNRIKNSGEVFINFHKKYQNCDRQVDYVYVHKYKIYMHSQNIF